MTIDLLLFPCGIDAVDANGLVPIWDPSTLKELSVTNKVLLESKCW